VYLIKFNDGKFLLSSGIEDLSSKISLTKIGFKLYKLTEINFRIKIEIDDEDLSEEKDTEENNQLETHIDPIDTGFEIPDA
jgi:hypothetical protein